MHDLKKLEPLSKFKNNGRLYKAVCKNCRMPSKYRSIMHQTLNGQVSNTKPKVPSKGTPIEKQPKGSVSNFYKVKPYPYVRQSY